MGRWSPLRVAGTAILHPAVAGVVGASLAVVVLVAGQKPSPRPRTTFVELDAVVVDGNGPVRGLHRDDFQVQEDGRKVAVTSFTEVSAAGIAGDADGRSVALLLDDTIGAAGTSIMQSLARLFLSRARPVDAVAVVRLTHREDEATGPFLIARDRIDEYRSEALPYFGRETIENALQAVTSISKQLEPIAHRRKVVICLGRRSVCDPYLDVPESSLMWPYWRDALSAAARANVSVYVADPAGVRGDPDLGDGLVDHTGGASFVQTNDFAHTADAIWNEAGHYYLLGYTPSARPRELHSIAVKMKPRGLHVRARLNRGD
jgi:VWFA-related protein